MKTRIITAILIVCALMVTCLTACGSSETLKTNYMDIKGIYYDKSYTDDEGSTVKRVYLFYDAIAKDKNFSVSCGAMKMKIKNGNTTNEYTSEFHKGAGKYASSYTYTSFVREVNVGETKAFLVTFDVPEAELASGRTVTLSYNNIPEIDKISFKTDSIVACESSDEIMKTADPEGYEAEQKRMEAADSETASMVKDAINGRYYTVSQSAGSTMITYRIDFSSPNNFKLTKPITNSGTYEVTNGYIIATYDNGLRIEIPWTSEGNGVSLDLGKTFSTYE